MPIFKQYSGIAYVSVLYYFSIKMTNKVTFGNETSDLEYKHKLNSKCKTNLHANYIV